MSVRLRDAYPEVLCITSALVDLPCGSRQTLTHCLSLSRPPEQKSDKINRHTRYKCPHSGFSVCQIQYESSALLYKYVCRLLWPRIKYTNNVSSS